MFVVSAGIAELAGLEGGSDAVVLVEYFSLVDAHYPVQSYDQEES